MVSRHELIACHISLMNARRIRVRASLPRLLNLKISPLHSSHALHRALCIVHNRSVLNLRLETFNVRVVERLKLLEEGGALVTYVVASTAAEPNPRQVAHTLQQEGLGQSTPHPRS